MIGLEKIKAQIARCEAQRQEAIEVVHGCNGALQVLRAWEAEIEAKLEDAAAKLLAAETVIRQTAPEFMGDAH